MRAAPLRCLALDLGVSGAPETFAVDGDGRVLDRLHPTVLDERSLQRLRGVLERAQ